MLTTEPPLAKDILLADRRLELLVDTGLVVMGFPFGALLEVLPRFALLAAPFDGPLIAAGLVWLLLVGKTSSDDAPAA